MGRIPDEMGPCGVFCGACPSQGRTCKGCGSEDREQQRTSKWGCKIRRCCHTDRDLDHCGLCEEHPCGLVEAKLLRPHPDDPRYQYRRAALASIGVLRAVGVRGWLAGEEARWRCPDCGGRVHFHAYVCSSCGSDLLGRVPPPGSPG